MRAGGAAPAARTAGSSRVGGGTATTTREAEPSFFPPFGWFEKQDGRNAARPAMVDGSRFRSIREGKRGRQNKGETKRARHRPGVKA
jgi:hypothetical protein